MGNVGFSAASSDFGAHDLADALDVLFIEAFKLLGIKGAAKGLGSLVAIFLKGLDFPGEAALEFDEAGVFLWVGNELAQEVGAEENSGEAGSGGLEADLGEFGGIMATEELGEVLSSSGGSKLGYAEV